MIKKIVNTKRPGFKKNGVNKPKSAKVDHSQDVCNKCHQKGHRPYDKNDNGTFKCPKKVRSTEKKAARRHLALAVRYGTYQPNAADSATASCATVVPASTVRAAASSAATPSVTELTVRRAIYRACLQHPETFLSEPAAETHYAQTLISELLPTFVGSTTEQDLIFCEAFAAADACNLRRAQLAAAAVAQGLVASAPASAAAPPETSCLQDAVQTGAHCVQPGAVEHSSAQSVQAVTAVNSDAAQSVQIANVAHGLAQSVPAAADATADAERCANPKPPAVESDFDSTHMPINGAVFDSIQAELLQPCTTDAYALKHTAVCTKYFVPPDNPFHVDASSAGAQLCNQIFWIHCPVSVRADY